MEFHITSFVLFVTSFILFFYFLVLQRSKSKLPPGPWKLPVIGNMHQLLNSLPHQGLRDLAKKHGPLMYLRIGQVQLLVVSSAEYAKEVLKAHDIAFASRPHSPASDIISYGGTGIVSAPYGKYWRQIRNISVQEVLSMKRVNSFRAIREAEMLDFINWILSKAGSPINLTSKLQTSTHILVSKIAFGEECTQHDEFRSVNEQILKVAAEATFIADAFPPLKLLYWLTGMRSKLDRIHKKRDAILSNILNEHIDRKHEPQDHEDLVDVLLKFHGHGDEKEFQLSLDNCKAIMSEIILAGTDSTSTTTEWAMAEMIKNPRIMKKAQAEVRQVFNSRGSVDETGIPELKYLKLVIKETLRLHPPTPLLIPRENEEVCEINGYGIPAKTILIVNAWAIGRDPKYWSEPERFNPERFEESHINFTGTNFEFIPFGAGRRICPGITFATTGVELPLSQMLYYFDWKLPNAMKPQDLEMTEGSGLTVKRKGDLYLIPTPYYHVSKP